MQTRQLWITMGPSASGKTTLGKDLHALLPSTFVDADDFHSQANKDKMARGQGLTDEDREPWLALLVQHIKTCQGLVILACSCLKKQYRDVFRVFDVHFIYISLDKQVLQQRLIDRQSHFAKIELLDSQLATLEDPAGEANVHVISTIDLPVLVELIKSFSV